MRTELKEIDPPPDVQETMNRVVKAENEKVAAIDFATATETIADGARRAEIKKAEGVKQAKILEAEGEAQAIQLVNQAADKYFVGNAQLPPEVDCGRGVALDELEDCHSGEYPAHQHRRRHGRHPAGERVPSVVQMPASTSPSDSDCPPVRPPELQTGDNGSTEEPRDAS